MKNNQMNFKFQTSNFKLFFVYLLICLFVYSAKVNAQQVSLSIYPTLVNSTIKPGKSILVAYRFENLGDPAVFIARILPFSPKDVLGNLKLENKFAGPIEFSLDNADIVLNEPFFLKSGQNQQLLLRMKIPEGASNGDYYYSFIVQSVPPPTFEGVSSSRAKVSIGSNILLTVTDSGNIDINGKIALFDLLPRYKLNLFGQTLRMFDSNDKIPVVLIVENKGINLIKPQGEIILKGNFGEKARFEILPQNILAQSQRLLSATPSAIIECAPQSKEKACLVDSTILLSGFFIGRYSLSTNFNFGQTTANLFASTSFLALPFKFIAVLLVAMISGIFIWKRIKEGEE